MTKNCLQFLLSIKTCGRFLHGQEFKASPEYWTKGVIIDHDALYHCHRPTSLTLVRDV